MGPVGWPFVALGVFFPISIEPDEEEKSAQMAPYPALERHACGKAKIWQLWVCGGAPECTIMYRKRVGSYRR